MSIITPTTYTNVRGLAIRPGGDVIDDPWATMVGNVHQMYSRGTVRIPIFGDDSPITTASTSYVQPEPLDGLTAVWRPARVTASDLYRITVYAFGKRTVFQSRVFDATVGGGGSLVTPTVVFGANYEWKLTTINLSASDVIDGSGDPIPLGLSFQVRAAFGTCEILAIHAVATIIDTSALP